MASLKVLRIAAAVASSGGLLASTGIAAHASPWAWQHHQAPKTVVTSTQVTSTNNKTNVNVANNNPQNAVSGDVVVASFPSKHHDDNMGSSVTAKSGDAGNQSGASFTVGVMNDGGSVTTTSTGSDMSGTSGGNTTVTNKQVTKTNNTTNLNVVNNNEQTAVSGNVVVLGNGGSATSGAASNNSTTSFTINVGNSGATQQ